jgi:hypothetical protein
MRSTSSRRFHFGIAFPALVCGVMKWFQMSPGGWIDSRSKNFHQNLIQKNSTQSFQTDKERREWHEKSNTVQALEKAVLAIAGTFIGPEAVVVFVTSFCFSN